MNVNAPLERPASGSERPRSAAGLLARNSALNLAGFGLAILVGIATMPAITRGLGAERFGLLGLVWAAIAFLHLMDLGLSRATTKFAAEALGRDDDRALRDIAGVAALMQLGASVIGGLLLAAAAPWIVERLEISAALGGEARRAFVLLAAAAPVFILTNTFRGLLEAAQRFDIVNAVRAPTSATNFLVPLAGAWLGWPIDVIVAGMVAARVLALAAYAAACLRAWPVLRQAVRPDRARVRELAGFGGWVALSSFLSPVMVYIDRFVIGALVTVAAVGFYAAPQEMVTRLYIVPASIVGTLFPAFAGRTPGRGRGGARTAAVHGGDDVLERMFVGGVKYLLCLLAPLLIVLAALAPDVLDLWLGDEFAARGAAALALLSIGMLFNGLASVPNTLIHAAGRPDVTAKFHLIELPIHLLVLWLMVHAWGITGAAAAWSIRLALDTALIYGAALRLRLVRPAAFARARLLAVALSLAALAATAGGIALLVDVRGARIAGVAAATALWAAWALTRALDSAERMELRLAFVRRAGRAVAEPSGRSGP